jgi:hypothetical protein
MVCRRGGLAEHGRWDARLDRAASDGNPSVWVMLERRRQGESLSAQCSCARIGVPRLVIALVAVACILMAAAASAAAQKPVNNLAPEVVGAPLVGERLVCGAGSWSGAVSEFRYEWLRDAIPTASGVTYVVTTADKGHSLWCVVTAIGGEGSAEAESSNSLAIPGGKPGSPPESTAAPEVSGTPAVGESLNCSTGTWSGSPTPTFTYQWVRDEGVGETIIESATASTYTVASEDEGHTLACKVTATNSAGSASKLSSNSLRVPGTKPQDKVAPEVLGIEPSAVGESLTCWSGTWSGSPPPTFTYHWVRDVGLPDETIIESAMGSTYMVEPADQLHSLSCKVLATNSLGSTEAPSSNSLTVRGSKPENTAPPRVSGTPAVGDPLTCEKGTWTGVPTPTYAYLWVRDQGEAIGSATSSVYTVKGEDIGHALSCDVTAANSEGSASQASEVVVVPAGAGGTPPKNKAPPEVTGTLAVGATLNCSEGKWSGEPAPTLAYQWLRDGSTIAAATASTYLVVEADEGHSLSCKVTAINDEGVASKDSNVLKIPGRAPENLEAPQVSGTPAVGQQLTCLRGTWNGQPVPTFTYQWLRDGTNIPSATASSYSVASEDRGASISCTVTAQNSAGMVEAISSNSLAIPGSQPQSTASPEVSGTPAVGNTLTCSPGTWNGQPTPTYTYQWLLGGISIPSATASTYTVATADRGLVLSCKVTASNREGTGSASSKGAYVRGIRPEDIDAPQVSGTPAVGQQLTCLRGIWNGAPPPAFTYQWLRDGTSIASATSSTYTVELADQGHLLSCDVAATNSEGSAEAESSNGLAILGGTVRTESRPELTFPPAANVAETATAAQILAALHVQLARMQHNVRIASLRKAGLWAFSFAAPAVGKLELSWYLASTGANHSAKTKPLLLALSTTSFESATTRTVKLRLTSAGRRLIGESKHIPLTVKGVFIRPHEPPVTWLETVLLSH